MAARGSRRPDRTTFLRPALSLLAGACCGLTGCAGGGWEELTSREYKYDFNARMKATFTSPDPLVVLKESTDGDKRARALRSLREPLQNGGTAEEQEMIVQILTNAVTGERQAHCRLAAIAALEHFKDPRAAEALKEAYYRAGSFSPEMATIIRCRSLAALGQTGNPAGTDLLVKVLREPPVEGPDQDKQQKMDERIAAARALGHFPNNIPVAQALAAVLQSDKDVALRVRIHESLVQDTGQHIPAQQPELWAQYLQDPQHPPAYTPDDQDLKSKVMELIPASWK